MSIDELTTHSVAEIITREIIPQRRVPVATYRFQFNTNFTFHDAQQQLSYLADLGISDCYASPIFAARAGSNHGYDVCNHADINPSLGGAAGFDALATALRERGMGLILDMVPNHMGINDASNSWWMDVLENGPSSIYAPHFDVEWQPLRSEMQYKVLLPILGDQYGNVLERGEFRLVYEDGAFFIYYYDHKLPVAPRTYSQILSYQLDELIEMLGEDDAQLQELQSILTAISYLPLRNELAPDKIAERNREKEIIKRRLAALYSSSPPIQQAIGAAVTAFNGQVGDPQSFDLMDRLLEAQVYRPAFWRVATEEINYRRFFDINDLAAIRVELPEVFQATHQLIFSLLADGKATGLRIDHPDGLWDPPAYFRQLQENYLLHCLQRCLPADNGGNGGTDRAEVAAGVSAWLDTMLSQASRSDRALTWPLYVVAEKILSAGESLPRDWAVDGTTGYDFLNAVNGIFVQSTNRKQFDRIYSHFTASTFHFADLVNVNKKRIMLVSLASEINELSYQLERISNRNRRYRDFTLNSLTFALREVIAALPVYRTYITGPETVAPWDARFIEQAVAEAKRRNPRTAEEIFNFIRDTLLLRNIATFAPEEQPSLIIFVMKFQQLTGPVMAKGVEDTTFYVYNRLVSLNEVGGHPEEFGSSVATFHRQNTERQRRWPHTMLASSTHDTKRSEDVRARINVLSELPREWQAALSRWSRQNNRKKTLVDGTPAPDRNDEYLLYQTLIGSWPLANSADGPGLTAQEWDEFRERIAAYMQKATKEAKVHTSWVNPNAAYDAAVQQFVLAVLDRQGRNPFLANMRAFQQRVAYFGLFNALAQLVLKLTAPGMPDVYQGTELWDFSLVDPDNRRPVNYAERQALLDALQEQVSQAQQGGNGQDAVQLHDLASDLLAKRNDGRIKLYVTWQTLSLRGEHQQLFAEGDYLPLEAQGPKREHLCAFARRLDAAEIITIVPRLIVGLTGGIERLPLGAEVWDDTWLDLPDAQPGQRYRNRYTGELLTVTEHEETPGLPMAEVLRSFPVAVLERIAST